jgi:hypothetical protein
MWCDTSWQPLKAAALVCDAPLTLTSVMYSPVSWYCALFKALSSSNRSSSRSVRLMYQAGAPRPSTSPSTTPATLSCVSGSLKSCEPVCGVFQDEIKVNTHSAAVPDALQPMLLPSPHPTTQLTSSMALTRGACRCAKLACLLGAVIRTHARDALLAGQKALCDRRLEVCILRVVRQRTRGWTCARKAKTATTAILEDALHGTDAGFSVQPRVQATVLTKSLKTSLLCCVGYLIVSLRRLPETGVESDSCSIDLKL